MKNKKITELNNRIEFLNKLKTESNISHTQSDENNTGLSYIRKHPFFYIGLALIVGILIGWWWGEARTSKTIYNQVSECLDNEKMNQSTMIECTYDALIQ